MAVFNTILCEVAVFLSSLSELYFKRENINPIVKIRTEGIEKRFSKQ